MVDDFRQPSKPGNKEVAKNEPDFIPPEDVAGQEDLSNVISQKSNAENNTIVNPSKKLKTVVEPFIVLKHWVVGRSKKQKIMLGLGMGVLVGLLVVGGLLIFNKPKPAPVAPVVVKKEEIKEPPKPTTEPSKLTGIQIPIELNLLPVTAIMIENSPDARPQSGLKEAGVVFEAVAEGGITRFLTLFQEAQPDYVGPVRSVRPYYLKWLQGFDAAVAHVGGSGEALEMIATEGIKDLDQSYNSGSFQRIRQRYAPHNVYTSLGALRALEKEKGWTSSNFTGFTRKVENAPPAPTVNTIDFAISGPLYNAHYDYVPATNTYNRSQAGQPHIDERSGVQLSPKVVIALVMPKGIHPDGIHTTYETIGSGAAYFFQDGGVTEGTWSKASHKEQFIFKNPSGTTVGLNPGQTWISIVGAAPNVSYRL